jgi:dihydrofolate reductase
VLEIQAGRVARHPYKTQTRCNERRLIALLRWLPGGAEAAQAYLGAGLVDEGELSQVPILLGGGERLFENVGTDLHGLELV